MDTRLACCVLLLASACTAAAAPGRLDAFEARYADLADAYAAIQAIDSGLVQSYGGRDGAAWRALQQRVAARLGRELPRLARHEFADAADRRAFGLMQANVPALSGSREMAPSGRCAMARAPGAGAHELHDALYACFDQLGGAIAFEGQRLTRLAWFGRLGEIAEPDRRRSLFIAMQPLWVALNGDDEPGSPYRRYIAATAADPAFASPVRDAARTLGIDPAEAGPWLERILAAWSESDAGPMVEPWDYFHANGAAARALAACITPASIVPASERYYADLGADLESMQVVHDTEPRAGKSPVAYTMPMRYGREVAGSWRPTVPRVSADVSGGDLGTLNELVHEDGHAVQYAAIRARPAFTVDTQEDSLYWEAFADVPSWSVYTRAWERRYLGCEAEPGDLRRAQYGSVMLDVAWGLFEVRMLEDPARDPNRLWSEITSRYLRIVPHPELSWWATRVQLVDLPGYMVTYALGAALTAELRERTARAIGGFDAGNPHWYPWLARELLGEGATRPASEILRGFLGRPPSPEPLIRDLRASPAAAAIGQR